jgi:hypothetical protein
MSEQRVLSESVWTPDRGLAQPEVRGISWENFLLSDDKYLGKWRTDSGIRITPETAIQSTVVLACCRILAETISGLPIHVYRRNPDGSEVIAKEMPLNKVLSFAPNEWQTKPEFFEQLVMNVTLWGNSYSLIRSGRYGSVSSLDNLHPSRMDVERLENRRLRYSYTDPETGRLERYNQDQLMHVRWTPEQDGIKGMVPVEIAREAIGLARACEQHAARFWANSARPGVVLTTEGTLSAEAAERLRDNWERLHKGSEKAYRTAVLTGGMKATELGFTNEASQFNATRAQQTEEICRLYRIPLHLVQGQSGGDLETQGQEFVTYTLMPWLTRIESAISRSLIVDDDTYYAKFDVRGLLRANSNQRASYYSTMLNLGVYTINDVLRSEGMKTLGDMGDHHFVPMNTQTLEEATKPKPEQPPPGAGGPPPPAPGGPPSMSEVKTGKAPIASPKGEASQPKQEDAIEESSADWEDAVEGRSATPAADRPKFSPIGKTRNSDFAVPPAEDEFVMALTGSNKSKGTKIGLAKSIEPGTPVALRIDIPAFNWSKENLGKSIYAVTIHENKGGKGFGSPIAYEPIARLAGPVTFASKENEAIKIATGESGKFPLATVKGQFDTARDVPADIDSWTAVGYDPKKAAYFYDKRTGQEVKGGVDAVSIGNTVFVREPDYGDRQAQHQYRSLADSWGLETRALSPANQELYKAQEKIVEENGQWSQHDSHYMAENPFASRGMKCSNCLYYEAGKCEIVTGSISPEGVCKLWIIPEEKLSLPESRTFCATGEGNGIDNSCGNDSPGSSGGDKPKPGSSSPKGDCPAPCHTVDPHKDDNGDGVTDAARVGVPAMAVPPPPAVGRVPNLDERGRAVEDAFISHFEADPDKVSAQFRDLVVSQGDPPTFGTDDAKVLTTAWSDPDPDVRAENRATLNIALHQTANAIAKRAFIQHLDTLKEGDEIMVTVGGCGAGKGFALKNNPDAMEMKKRAKVVWDSAGDQNATENPWILKEAEARGLKVNYVFVHANPETQWADPDRGVVKRASDPKDGRMVDAKVFADSYAIGARNHDAFHKANKDNPSAKFVFLDNTGKPKQIDGVPQEALSLDADKLAEFAQKAVEKSSAPERVKTGALLGRKIWPKKKGGN